MADGLQSVAVNGVALFSAPRLASGNPSSILFGDGTGRANAHADIASLTFVSSVPEPGSWMLLVMGLRLMAALRLCRSRP